ncbi:MAG TPA: GLUG motif-containing protein, partial [Rhizomicrobium sp.]|nr:GLUG motif-containing protein [Rhizomicrobium sp.]
PSGFYVLTNSYDASADGTYRSSPISAPFSGYFEALGNTISGMKIKADAGGAVGLFAHLTGIQGFGVVRNLRLTNASVKSSHASNMGGIAGFVEQGSIISQSSVTGEVKAGESSDAGGVAGFINFGTVTSSRSSVNVAVGGEFAQAGGLVGAFGDGTLKNSYATGAVAGGDESETGGLVGYNGAPVADSFATGAVRTGAHGEAGGLVGHNGGRVKNSYAEGDVSATGVGSSLGGLMGRDEAGAVASYSTGKITGVSDVVGGVVGTDCSGGGEECRPGGYRNTDWNTTTSELSQGAGNINDDKGLQSLTSHKLRSGLPQGFSEKVWTEQGITNRGFPYLINNPPPQ